MPAAGFKKPFRTEAKRHELLDLLKTDKSYCSIARHFGVDHTSVAYQAKKLGVEKIKRRYEKRVKTKEENCQRCDLLFAYGGAGDGKWCDECLNEVGIL